MSYPRRIAKALRPNLAKVGAGADLGPPAIFDAFVKVFTTEGYAATTTLLLFEAAEVDRPTFDSLFADKEDCFLRTYDSLIAEALEILTASTSLHEAWPQRVASGLSALFELIEARPRSARLVLVNATEATPTIGQRHTATINCLAPIIGEGRLITDRPVPPALDWMLPSGVAYVLGSHLRGAGAGSLAELYPAMLRFLLRPYLGETSSSPSLLDRCQGAGGERGERSPHARPGDRPSGPISVHPSLEWRPACSRELSSPYIPNGQRQRSPRSPPGGAK